jgi:hypothetical protein
MKSHEICLLGTLGTVDTVEVLQPHNRIRISKVRMKIEPIRIGILNSIIISSKEQNAPANPPGQREQFN